MKRDVEKQIFQTRCRTTSPTLTTSDCAAEASTNSLFASPRQSAPLSCQCPELEHLVLARPSPHGTPVRSTPREPSGGGPSSEGAGGSAGASSETEEKPRGKRRKPTKGKRSGKQRRIGRDETKAERTEVG